MPCRGVALVKSQENIEGFLLVEVLLYMTIFSLVIGMVLLLHNEEQREYHVFDREGRILFAHVKRMQLATLYGNLQNNNGANRVVLERMRYGYNLLELTPVFDLQLIKELGKYLLLH